jgi:hypothetical protein
MKYLKKIKGLVYNIVFFKDKVYLFPRTMESPHFYPQLKIGTLELVEKFTFIDPHLFGSIKEKELEKILSEVTVL